MPYLEKDFQTAFNRWLKVIYRQTGAFELKLVKGKTLPFSAVKDHQEQALFHVKHGILPYKIPDDTFAPKPFDCFCMASCGAFVVVMFNGKNTIFYMLDIDAWLHEKQQSGNKSLSEERAAEIGQKYDLGGSIPFARKPFSSTPVNPKTTAK